MIKLTQKTHTNFGCLFLALLAAGICQEVKGGDTSLRLRMAPGPEITISGDVGSTHQVQYLDALTNTNAWSNLTNVVLSASPFTFYDTNTSATGRRFYRAVVQGTAGTNAPTNMVWVAAGSFMMGSPESDPDLSDFEIPQSLVTLTHGFWIGKYEVTQSEYQSVMGGNPSAFTDDPNLPVDSVTWSDATNYCSLLTASESKAGRLLPGYAYRLPTEAEWEYAARAGKSTRFSFGDDLGFVMIGQYAWTAENSGNTSHPVGGKTPNAWGIFDIYGNASEWCMDWFSIYTSSDKTNPTGPANGFDRVYRGGSWGDSAADCRVSTRGGLNPNSRIDSFGFRVVLAPVQL